MSAERNFFKREWQLDADMPPKAIAAQLDTDYRLLTQVADNAAPATLRLWSSQSAVVVSQSEARLENYPQAVTALARKGWQVLPRNTGGTAFAQTPEVLNVSAVCIVDKESPSIKECYEHFCTLLMDALENLGLNASTGSQARAFCDGDYNILIDEKKLVGTAQRWKRVAGQSSTAVLSQAAILVSVDTDEICSVINEFYEIAGLKKTVYADALIDLQTALERNKSSAHTNLLSTELKCQLADHIKHSFYLNH